MKDRNDMEARAAAMERPREEQESPARRLMDRLLAHPEERQLALARTPEFGALSLADLLLQESASAQPKAPARTEGLARLALAVAGQPRGRQHAERVADLAARALVLLGDARRLQGDRLEADERFRQAAFHLTGPPDDVARALYCQRLAALRREQCREDEALGLLWRAAGLYRDHRDFFGEGECLAELGFILLAADQVHEALSPLARACPMLDFQPLGRRARLALAVGYARTGHGEKARALVAATRALYGRIPGSAAMGEGAWMEGEVALLTGERVDAAALLETARQCFLTAGKVDDAALATLDLVLALPESRRLSEIHRLAHEIAERFPADPNLGEALKALVAVEMAAAGHVQGSVEEVSALAAERLRRVRRYPQLRFAGLSGPGRAPAPSTAGPSLQTLLREVFSPGAMEAPGVHKE